ncbi:MAG: carbon storage regulator CsrA [Planctomycetota bacterium]|jgi:carbon storage regulator|nr:carbon storage regulator CsrA [Planctomycetota bacterium]MDP7132076.1 carbon storage regulator CsrA [Planctomycetota bacterium]MDP7249615.1 carbon storage regulator CsrA [Planctomycetota bacterium]
MLVLTRKVDESIIIGEDINIKILALSGSQVKIGISAPRTLRILRKEVYDDIKEEEQSAPQPDAETPPQAPQEPAPKQPEASGAQQATSEKT